MPGADTTDTYRYATLNGVHLALPTRGDGATTEWFYLADNGSYTDLAEIWDSHNSGYQTAGVPSGWQSTLYWSATPSSSGHANVNFNNGNVNDNNDSNNYVALQVL